MINRILCIFFMGAFVWAQCDEGEVELWDVCYDISTTTSLNLNTSGLSGEIPPEIGDLINLSYINLSDNNLTGPIPQELDDLVYVHTLYLQNNNLSGELPEGIFWNPWYYEEAYDDDTFVEFLWINLSNNQFTGELTEVMFDHAQWSYENRC